MRKHTFRSALCILAVFLANHQALAQDCAGMRMEDFESVSSKREIEGLIEDEIIRHYSERGRIDWDCLIREFRSLGENYSAKFYPNGGFDDADVIRFTIDKSNFLNDLIKVPGASNGVFTAIINTAGGQVAIVERGGKLRWLRLEQNPQH